MARVFNCENQFLLPLRRQRPLFKLKMGNVTEVETVRLSHWVAGGSGGVEGVLRAF